MTARLLFAASLLMAVPVVYAQDATAPPASSGPSAAAPVVRMHSQRAPMDGGEMHGREMRGHSGGMGLMLPEGTWWRNPELVSRIGLTPEQQKHIDDIFLQSRVQLIHMPPSLEEEQLLLEPLLNANPVDQT